MNQSPTESALAASILALHAAREYIGEDNNPRSNRVLQKIKNALDAIADTSTDRPDPTAQARATGTFWVEGATDG